MAFDEPEIAVSQNRKRGAADNSPLATSVWLGYATG
jgi:hypothetical protein